MAIALFAVGFFLEPSRAAMFLYVSGILCAGARVVRFIVTEVRPGDMYQSDRLAPDEDPVIEPSTGRPVQP